jgi:hypothetical protein
VRPLKYRLHRSTATAMTSLQAVARPGPRQGLLVLHLPYTPLPVGESRAGCRDAAARRGTIYGCEWLASFAILRCFAQRAWRKQDVLRVLYRAQRGGRLMPALEPKEIYIALAFLSRNPVACRRRVIPVFLFAL